MQGKTQKCVIFDFPDKSAILGRNPWRKEVSNWGRKSLGTPSTWNMS